MHVVFKPVIFRFALMLITLCGWSLLASADGSGVSAESPNEPRPAHRTGLASGPASGPDSVLKPEPNTVRWATASERDNFGFEVYRGLSESGPFEKINPDVIRAAGTTDMPQRYEYTDDTNEPDTIYWYYIESISMNGERKRISPVYSSEPKPGKNW